MAQATRGISTFHNGRGAPAVAVDVRAIDQGVEIRDRADGLMLALWAYADLAPPPGDSRSALGLACRGDPDARLIIRDAAVAARVRQAVGRPRAISAILRRSAKPGAIAVAILTLTAILWWSAGPLARILPPPRQRSVEACRNAAGQAALDTLARQLALPARVQAVKDAVASVTTLTDGTIILPSTIIDASPSADALADALLQRPAADPHAVAGHPRLTGGQWRSLRAMCD